MTANRGAYRRSGLVLRQLAACATVCMLTLPTLGCEEIASALAPFKACCLRISPNPAADGETVRVEWEIEADGGRFVRWKVSLNGEVMRAGSRNLPETDEWLEAASFSASR